MIHHTSWQISVCLCLNKFWAVQAEAKEANIKANAVKRSAASQSSSPCEFDEVHICIHCFSSLHGLIMVYDEGRCCHNLVTTPLTWCSHTCIIIIIISGCLEK